MCILKTQNKLWIYNSTKTKTPNKLRLSEINKLNSQKKKGGGEKAMAKQHEQGKLSARERIAYLLDNDEDAIEIAAFAGHENVCRTRWLP